MAAMLAESSQEAEHLPEVEGVVSYKKREAVMQKS